MLIQPFLENAIKHGIRPKQDQGNILVNIKKNVDNILSITIEDDGIGRSQAAEMKKESLIDSTSIGIQKTKERLAIMSSQQEREAKIDITDLYDNTKTPCGTRVEIYVPV
jgi:sensor histidine kinase YesM